MSSRTKFEIETFLLGSHPTVERQALELQRELMQAREHQSNDLTTIELIAAEFEEKNGTMDALVANIEATEEEYMASLSDDAFASCVKSATTLAKSLNDSVKEIEQELGQELTS